MLLEADRLGLGQTVSSQGILHSGLKYSLQGLLTSAAREAREMPALWRRCLEGTCEPNLSATRVLSDGFHLWGTDSTASRIGLLGAKMGLRVTPEAVAPEHVPAALAGCGGTVYRVPEQVIAPRSFVECLAKRNAERLLKIDPEHGLEFARAGETRGWRIHLRGPAELELARSGLCSRRERETKRSANGWTSPHEKCNGVHCIWFWSGERCRSSTATVWTERKPACRSHRVLIARTNRVAGWRAGFRGRCGNGGRGVDPTRACGMSHRSAGSRFFRDGMVDLPRRSGGGGNAHRRTPRLVPRDSRGERVDSWPTKLVLAPQLAAALWDEMRAGDGAKPEVDNSAAWDASVFAGWPRPSVSSPPWDDVREWRMDAGGKRRDGHERGRNRTALPCVTRHCRSATESRVVSPNVAVVSRRSPRDLDIRDSLQEMFRFASYGLDEETLGAHRGPFLGARRSRLVCRDSEVVPPPQRHVFGPRHTQRALHPVPVNLEVEPCGQSAT